MRWLVALGLTVGLAGSAVGAAASPRIDVDGLAVGVVDAGDQLCTDSSRNGATGNVPVEVCVRSPNEGDVNIGPGVTPEFPKGFSVLGHTVWITAPEATQADPLEITFWIDSSAFPGDLDHDAVAVYRDGVDAARCVDRGSASPDPCLLSIDESRDDLVVTVLTSQASAWTLVASEVCGGVPATIVGDSGDNVIIGTEAADVIWAGGGDDTVEGLGGNDTICGGRGLDTLKGGIGSDEIYGGPGDDILRGGSGLDVIEGGDGADRLFGNKGRDRLRGGAGPDRLFGNGGDDIIKGNSGWDRANGGRGLDVCYGTEALFRCENV